MHKGDNYLIIIFSDNELCCISYHENMPSCDDAIIFPVSLTSEARDCFTNELRWFPIPTSRNVTIEQTVHNMSAPCMCIGDGVEGTNYEGNVIFRLFHTFVRAQNLRCVVILYELPIHWNTFAYFRFSLTFCFPLPN